MVKKKEWTVQLLMAPSSALLLLCSVTRRIWCEQVWGVAAGCVTEGHQSR